MEKSDEFNLQLDVGEFSVDSNPTGVLTRPERVEDDGNASLVTVVACNPDTSRVDCKAYELELIGDLFGKENSHLVVEDTNRTLGNMVIRAKKRDSGAVSMIKLQLYPAADHSDAESELAGWRVPRSSFEKEMVLTRYFGTRLLPGRTPKVRDSGRKDITSYEKFKQHIQAGRLAREIPYFEMDYVDGKPLAAIGDIDDPEMHGKIYADLAYTLALMHDKDCVHRDIKPENIVVTPEERGVLLDFGTTVKRKCLEGIVGTIPYISPAQVKFDVEDKQDPSDKEFARVDLYSFGLTMHEVTVGRQPLQSFYDLTSTRSFYSFLLEDPNISTVGSISPTGNEALDEAIGRCLTNDETKMYASARELAEFLNKHFRQEELIFPEG